MPTIGSTGVASPIEWKAGIYSKIKWENSINIKNRHMKWLFSLAWCMVIFTTNGQTVYIATDTLELEIGSGYDLDQNGNKNGEWEYPFDNNPKNYVMYKATYKRDTLNGPFIAFWPDGKIKAKLNFKDGVKSGEATYHYRDGKIEYQMNYANDTLNGTFIAYFKSGRKASQLNFKMGLLDGHNLAFDDDANSSLFAEGDFLLGVRHGKYVRYVNKHRKIEEFFDHGFPAEGQKIFYDNQLVSELSLDRPKREYSKVITYKGGKKTGEQPIPEGMKRDFIYGKYLMLPLNFK